MFTRKGSLFYFVSRTDGMGLGCNPAAYLEWDDETVDQGRREAASDPHL